MKPVLQNKKYTPFSVKAGFFLAFSLLIIAAYFSIVASKGDRIKAVLFSESKTVPPPDFSKRGGFYSDSLLLEISGKCYGEIYYTLDGSKPGANALKYSGPLKIVENTDANKLSEIPGSPRWLPPIGNVFKGTVVRAVFINRNGKISPESKSTFFIHPLGRGRYSLSVVSLMVDSSSFFGFRKGIYVMGKGYEDKDNYAKKNIKLDVKWWDYPANYKKRGADTDRPVYFTYHKAGSNDGFSANAAARIHGNATRAYSQKSLRISFNNEDSGNTIEYPFFKNRIGKSFNSIILRNSGNDWDRTLFGDALMQGLMEETGLDLQAYSPSVVFINGEYWGIHNIRERISYGYFLSNYGIPEESVEFIDLNRKRGAKEEQGFERLLDYVKENDLAQQEHYDYVKGQMEIENFIDYLIANIYFSNTDWPNNNVRCWRKKNSGIATGAPPGNDGRWRWLLFDTDYGFGYKGLNSAINVNMLERSKKTGKVGVLFTALLKNSSFREDFGNRFLFHLDNTFETQHVIRRIDSMQSVLAPEMAEHIKRWQKPSSMRAWEENIEVFRKFAEKRPEVQRAQLKEFFSKN
jgi:hypothetical protein